MSLFRIIQREATIGDPRDHMRQTMLMIERGDGERLSIAFIQSGDDDPANAYLFAGALRQLSEAMIEKFRLPVTHEKSSPNEVPS